MLAKTEILEALHRQRKELKRHGVTRLGLFGSFARGEAKDTSDIDFLVEFESIRFDDYMAVKFLLEDMFGRRVDLVPVPWIKPRLRDDILSEVVDVPGL